MNIILLLILLASSSSSVSCTARAQSPSPVTPNEVTVKATLLMSLVIFLFALLLTAFCSLFVRYFSRQHPAFLRITRGLDPRVLATCPVMSYSALKLNHLKSPQNAALQCTVCLADFDDADALRLLPKCGHVFHTHCIDAWLAAHVTCPVCRGEVRAETEGKTRVRRVLEEDSGDFRVFVRSHSTGSLDGFSMKFSEDVAKKVPEDGERMKRSSSYDVVLGIGEVNVGSTKTNNKWVLTMNPPTVSGNSMIPRLWGASVVREEKEFEGAMFFHSQV
ncbi:unnamed protein product [Sphenostylis stenocarpa]|uniref:RING-type E3 ubiquitin transferase n=1 Tax=Sphenostylis stenocarpa TaxID=92480 RepID=A0AA86SDA0_9FABA|nr:unnamed protein product [Sphenostylis stenocarpa]